jgi:hypothetical protein
MSTALDVSVEFSHIYSDESAGPEHLLGIQHAQRELRRLTREGKRTLSLVLLDDLHISGISRGADEIKAEMEKLGGRVDVVIRESDILTGVLTFLRNLRPTEVSIESFRKQNKQVLFINTGEDRVSLGCLRNGAFTPTCALLAAIWHIARLGEIAIGGIPSASRTLTILESRYQLVERKALSIIKASRYAAALSRIEHIFL